MRDASNNLTRSCGTALFVLAMAAGFEVQPQCQTKTDVTEIGKRTTALVYYHTRADVTPESPSDPNVIGVVSGSAFCISNTGYYITNAHVVNRSYKRVMLSFLPFEKGMKTHIADVVAVDNGGNHFYPRLYNIPQSMTKGKNSIVVTFKDHPGNVAGGIYGCATVVVPYTR